MVVTLITQRIRRPHQLHRPISVTSWGKNCFSYVRSNHATLFCRRSTNWLLRLIYEKCRMVQCRFFTTGQSTMASWWLCLWPFIVVRKCETVQPGGVGRDLNWPFLSSQGGILIPIVDLPAHFATQTAKFN